MIIFGGEHVTAANFDSVDDIEQFRDGRTPVIDLSNLVSD